MLARLGLGFYRAPALAHRGLVSHLELAQAHRVLVLRLAWVRLELARRLAWGLVAQVLGAVAWALTAREPKAQVQAPTAAAQPTVAAHAKAA